MNPKILVVDDEAYIRLLLELTLEPLEESGVVVLSAEDGRSALDMIKAEKPNLVFLDVMMPEVDGLTVCQTVKQEWGMTDTYIVLLTAKSQEIDIAMGKQAGADEYITKPFDPDELLEHTEKILGLNQ